MYIMNVINDLDLASKIILKFLECYCKSIIINIGQIDVYYLCRKIRLQYILAYGHCFGKNAIILKIKSLKI